MTLAPVLDFYRETLDDTAVLVPVGGVRCLDFLADLTTGASCALVADKGHCTVVELCSHAGAVGGLPRGRVLADGQLRLPGALRARARWAGRPARRSRRAAWWWPRTSAGELDDRAQFEALVHDGLLDLGPDNYFTIRPLLVQGTPPAVETLLAGLRLSRYDPSHADRSCCPDCWRCCRPSPRG